MPEQHPWSDSKRPCDFSQTYQERAASAFWAGYPRRWVPEEDLLCIALLESLALLLGIESRKVMFLLSFIGAESEATQFGALQN